MTNGSVRRNVGPGSCPCASRELGNDGPGSRVRGNDWQVTQSSAALWPMDWVAPRYASMIRVGSCSR